MLFPGEVSGYTRITTSGAIGPASEPIVVRGYSVENGSGGVGQPYFKDGGSTGSLAFRGDNSQGSANGSRTITPPNIMLGNGCYVSFDANTSAITVFWTLGQ